MIKLGCGQIFCRSIYFLRLLDHLEFGNSKSGLSDGDGKVVNLDAEELRDRNFYRVD